MHSLFHTVMKAINIHLIAISAVHVVIDTICLIRRFQILNFHSVKWQFVFISHLEFEKLCPIWNFIWRMHRKWNPFPLLFVNSGRKPVFVMINLFNMWAMISNNSSKKSLITLIIIWLISIWYCLIVTFKWL